MKQWEDMIKDKLEGYESDLPEGSLAAFRSLRDAGLRKKRTVRLAWGWSAAVAAGLAAAFFLLRPGDLSEEGVQVVPQASVARAEQSDDTFATAEIPAAPLTVPASRRIAHAVMPGNGAAPERFSETDAPETASPEIAATAESEAPAERKEAPTDRQEMSETSAPTADEEAASGVAGPRMGKTRETDVPYPRVTLGAATGVAAGSLAAALTSALFSAHGTGDMVSGPMENMPPLTDPEGPKDVLTGARHNFPLKTGLSARIPVSKRLRITTGLTYTLYTSRLDYSLSGEMTQSVRYLGIPVRLDGILASGKQWDVYVGGGFAWDFCTGASLGGARLKKDGPAFSLLGAGGLQWNMTRRLGLYIEPELSWNFPSENRVLETRRSEHPLMFSVGTGLRIQLGKQE